MPPSLVALDVLLPTTGGTDRLAPVLAGLRAQTTRGFRVVVSDSSPAAAPGRDPASDAAWEQPAVRQEVAELRHDGVRVELHAGRLPGGEAGQLAFLLDRTRARQVLLLGEDVVLDPQALAVLSRALDQLRCGVVGMVPVREGQRPPPRAPAPRRWVRGVLPETLGPGSEEWQERGRVVPPRASAGDTTWWPYRAGSLRGCALYRRRSLIAVGGFGEAPFATPPVEPGHPSSSGDVAAGGGAPDAQLVAQLKVMARDGAAAVAPTAATRLPTHGWSSGPTSACSGSSRVRHEA